jgi:hypothetical protein
MTRAVLVGSLRDVRNFAHMGEITCGDVGLLCRGGRTAENRVAERVSIERRNNPHDPFTLPPKCAAHASQNIGHSGF